MYMLCCCFVQVNKPPSVAYPKEVHSKIMQRRSSKDLSDGKSPKHTGYMVCVFMYTIWHRAMANLVIIC